MFSKSTHYFWIDYLVLFNFHTTFSKLKIWLSHWVLYILYSHLEITICILFIWLCPLFLTFNCHYWLHISCAPPFPITQLSHVFTHQRETTRTKRSCSCVRTFLFLRFLFFFLVSCLRVANISRVYQFGTAYSGAFRYFLWCSLGRCFVEFFLIFVFVLVLAFTSFFQSQEMAAALPK